MNSLLDGINAIIRAASQRSVSTQCRLNRWDSVTLDQKMAASLIYSYVQSRKASPQSLPRHQQL